MGSQGAISEMVERVAKALCLSDGIDPDGNAYRDFEPDCELPAWRRLGYQEAAIVAIKAMREPTRGMLGADSIGGSKRMIWLQPDMWRRAIDDALDPNSHKRRKPAIPHPHDK
jgi:hypothetical protein